MHIMNRDVLQKDLKNLNLHMNGMSIHNVTFKN